MTTQTLNDALSDFYEVKLGGLSPNTRRQYEATLERFRGWVTRETQPNVYLQDIDDRMMVRYFNRLLPPGHSPQTYNNYRQVLKKFWDFCRGEAWIGVNPMRHVDPLKVPRLPRLMLSADEMIRMQLEAKPRDRIALAIGANCALRAGEITALTIGSVNLGDDLLAIYRAKTKEADLLPIPTELRVELLRWMHHYAETMGIPFDALPNTWRLVPPLQSTAVSPHDSTLGRRETYVPHRELKHAERIVIRALAKLGHPTHREGFHTLRRSTLRVAHDLSVADGNPDALRIAQAWAGHKNQATTELYIGISRDKQRRDDMLRGRSYLTRAVAAQEARRQVDEEGRDGVRRVV
jgi:integrase